MRIEEMLLKQSFFQRDLKYGNAIIALLILNKLCLLRFMIKDNLFMCKTWKYFDYDQEEMCHLIKSQVARVCTQICISVK